MLKKEHQNCLTWTECEKEAFTKLKQALVTSLVLATLDFTEKIFMECDASRIGLGAVLM